MPPIFNLKFKIVVKYRSTQVFQFSINFIYTNKLVKLLIIPILLLFNFSGAVNVTIDYISPLYFSCKISFNTIIMIQNKKKKFLHAYIILSYYVYYIFYLPFKNETVLAMAQIEQPIEFFHMFILHFFCTEHAFKSLSLD